MTGIRSAALVAGLSLLACTELGDVERDECGNGVIEPMNGEDCDGADGCGEVGTEQACRILCSEAAACPGNAACGIDGVCHEPSGAFALTTSVPWTTPHLLVADTSGDGYPELVGVGAQHVDVRLGARDLSLSPLPPIPSPPLSGTPRTADLEGDGDADIAIPVGAGVFSLSGNAATVLDPFFYNSFDAPADGRIVAVGVTFADLISIPLIAAHDAGSNLSILVFAGFDGGAVPFPTGRTVDEVVGDTLPVGKLIDNSLASRTIALPFATGRAIALYDANVVALDNVTLTARPAVTLPLNTAVKNGAWFADFDGDAHQDLVVSVTIGGVEGVAVAWGNGSGGLADNTGAANTANIVWRADRDQDGQPGNDGPLAPVMVGQVTDNLIILGDENDADVVAGGGLYTTACVFRNQCALHLLRPSTRAWTGASIADVNLDTLPDVAAFSAGQTGIDVLLNTTTTLLFNDAIVPTNNAVERLFPGDFNGDTIEDLGYVDAILGVPFTDALSVAYGRQLDAPSPPVFMGTVGELVAGGGLLATSSTATFDFVDDLVIVTDRQVGGATRRGAAILFGSTTRRLFAPLLPEAIPRGNRAVQSTQVVDMFTVDGNADPYHDLVVVTQTTYGPDLSGGADTGGGLVVPHARFYAGQEDGQADEVATIDLSLVPLELAGTHWLGADVMGSEVHEAVGLRTNGALVMVRLDSGCTGAACIIPVAAPPAPVSDPVAFHAVDIDDDGDRDLVAMMRNRDASSGTGTRDASIVVWWNDGGFDPSRTQVIAGTYADAALVDLDRDGTRELVLLERADRDGAAALVASHLDAGVFRDFAPLAGVTDGVALHAADLNGDALDDLVVVTGVERNAPRELAIYTQSENRISTGAE